MGIWCGIPLYDVEIFYMVWGYDVENSAPGVYPEGVIHNDQVLSHPRGVIDQVRDQGLCGTCALKNCVARDERCTL